MSLTSIDIANRALLRVGAERIASFDDRTTEAAQAAAEYEALVAAKLAERRWRFAAAEATLARLAATPQSGRWLHAHQLPPDLIALHNVTAAGMPVRFDRLGDKVFADDAGPLVIEYTWRAPEHLWPGHFAAAFTSELTALLARGLRNDLEFARLELREAAAAWQRAALEDSQQRTARRLPVSPLITVRRGGYWSMR